MLDHNIKQEPLRGLLGMGGGISSSIKKFGPEGCAYPTGDITGSSISYSLNGGSFTSWGGSATNLAGGYYEIATGWTTIAWKFTLASSICGQNLKVTWVTGNDPNTASKSGYFYINDVTGTTYNYTYTSPYQSSANLGSFKSISSFTLVVTGSNGGNTGLIGSDNGAGYGFTIDNYQLR